MNINQNKIIQVETTEGLQEVILPVEDFGIDPTDIDAVLCKMGKLLLYYGEVEAALKMEVERKEADLEKLEADFDSHVRWEAKTKSEKITEKQVETKVTVNPQRLQLIENLHRSRKNYNLARWAMKALDAKKDCLLAIAYRDKEIMRVDRYNR